MSKNFKLDHAIRELRILAGAWRKCEKDYVEEVSKFPEKSWELPGVERESRAWSKAGETLCRLHAEALENILQDLEDS